MINYMVTHLSSVIATSSLAQELLRAPLIPSASRHDEQIQHQLICWVASHFLAMCFSSQLQSVPATIIGDNLLSWWRSVNSVDQRGSCQGLGNRGAGQRFLADRVPGGSQTFYVHLLGTLFVVYVLVCMYNVYVLWLCSPFQTSCREIFLAMHISSTNWRFVTLLK